MTTSWAIDADDIRALARSSRVLWRTVRLVIDEGDPRRVWIRRPDDFRIETVGGKALRAHAGEAEAEAEAFTRTVGRWLGRSDGEGSLDIEQHGGPTAGPVVFTASPAGVSHAEVEEILRGWADELAEPPPLRSDGLVDLSDTYCLVTDPGADQVPYMDSYLWIAALEPLELADGQEPEPDWDDLPADVRSAIEAGTYDSPATPAPPPGEYTHVRSVEVRGRTTWEARITPAETYAPRCSCCPLLLGDVSVRLDGLDSAGQFDARDFLVRLDRQTGICVYVEALDGSTPGPVISVTIEEVDVEYPDWMFASGKFGPLH